MKTCFLKETQKRFCLFCYLDNNMNTCFHNENSNWIDITIIYERQTISEIIWQDHKILHNQNSTNVVTQCSKSFRSLSFNFLKSNTKCVFILSFLPCTYTTFIKNKILRIALLQHWTAKKLFSIHPCFCVIAKVKIHQAAAHELLIRQSFFYFFTLRHST